MKFSIGISPCPNDTYIFDALINKKIDTQGFEFDLVLDDVESLNLKAAQELLDITKLSFGAYLNLTQPYALLHSGSAFGYGVGPILVSKEPMLFSEINHLKIAIPGLHTTANLLLSLAAPLAKNKIEIVFSDIENEVLNGRFDLGLIIHESRFTYQQKGLHKVLDLGDWWEHKVGAAIPLGCIVMKRTFDKNIISKIDLLIKQSLQFAINNKHRELPSFVTSNAQEMSAEVMKKHIDLYVNNFSIDLGSEGQQSIQFLLNEARLNNFINNNDTNIDKLFY